MFSGASRETPERIGFLLVPQFSMMAFFSAVEPLRIANRASGRELYSWHVFSVDGQPVEASNGMTVVADRAISAVESFPAVVVCASFEPWVVATPAVFRKNLRIEMAVVVSSAPWSITFSVSCGVSVAAVTCTPPVPQP